MTTTWPTSTLARPIVHALIRHATAAVMLLAEVALFAAVDQLWWGPVWLLSRATTDPAFQALRDWVTSADAHAELVERRRQPKTITHPKLARPAGRANDNPYAITR